jgi:hypothetical protein
MAVWFNITNWLIEWLVVLFGAEGCGSEGGHSCMPAWRETKKISPAATPPLDLPSLFPVLLPAANGAVCYSVLTEDRAEQQFPHRAFPLDLANKSLCTDCI